MCQLNLYLIKNTVSEEKIIDALQSCLAYGKAEKVSDDEIIDGFMEDFEGYNCYICSAMHCNCGTIQCLLQSEKEYKNYADYKTTQKQILLNNLLKTKELLMAPNFKERHEQLLNEYNKISSKLNEEFDKAKKSRPFVDPTTLPQYKKLIDCITENEYLLRSSIYTLGKPRKNVFELNIDDEIEKVKSPKSDESEQEFNDLKKFLGKAFEMTDEVILYSFWQDDEPLYIKTTKTIPFKDLTIEDIVFLNYHDVLKITK